jgi:hypothetical protein
MTEEDGLPWAQSERPRGTPGPQRFPIIEISAPCRWTS